MKCYIFDLILQSMVLEKKITLLKKCNIKRNKHLVLVNHHIEYIKKNINHILDKAIAGGYEGIIMRKCLGTARGYNK